MALDAGTHLDVGWAGVEGRHGCWSRVYKKKGMGYVITREKLGSGIKDWCGHQVLDIWIVMVWISLK